MYRVLCDGLPIYDLRDENLVLIDPKLDLEVNKAGAFSFKMPPQHPQYELPQKMLSCIQVFQDEEEVFNGRITECKIGFTLLQTYKVLKPQMRLSPSQNILVICVSHLVMYKTQIFIY